MGIPHATSLTNRLVLKQSFLWCIHISFCTADAWQPKGYPKYYSTREEGCDQVPTHCYSMHRSKPAWEMNLILEMGSLFHYARGHWRNVEGHGAGCVSYSSLLCLVPTVLVVCSNSACQMSRATPGHILRPLAYLPSFVSMLACSFRTVLLAVWNIGQRWLG